MKETMKMFIECTVPTRACNMKCDYVNFQRKGN